MLVEVEVETQNESKAQILCCFNDPLSTWYDCRREIDLAGKYYTKIKNLIVNNEVNFCAHEILV